MKFTAHQLEILQKIKDKNYPFYMRIPIAVPPLKKKKTTKEIGTICAEAFNCEDYLIRLINNDKTYSWLAIDDPKVKKISIYEYDRKKAVFKFNDLYLGVIANARKERGGLFIEMRYDVPFEKCIKELPKLTLKLLDTLEKYNLITRLDSPCTLVRDGAISPCPHTNINPIPTQTTYWIVDKRYYTRNKNDVYLQSILQKMKSFNLNGPVVRTEHGPYLIFEWLVSSSDILFYPLEQARQSVWVRENLHVGIRKPQFLENGDVQLSFPKSNSKDLVFYYNYNNEALGLIGIPMTKENLTLSDKDKKRIDKLFKSSTVERPIKSIGLILPSRDIAVALYPKLTDKRLHVYYPGKNYIIDPFPRPCTGTSSKNKDALWLHEFDPNYPRGVSKEYAKLGLNVILG